MWKKEDSSNWQYLGFGLRSLEQQHLSFIMVEIYFSLKRQEWLLLKIHIWILNIPEALEIFGNKFSLHQSPEVCEFWGYFNPFCFVILNYLFYSFFFRVPRIWRDMELLVKERKSKGVTAWGPQEMKLWQGIVCLSLRSCPWRQDKGPWVTSVLRDLLLLSRLFPTVQLYGKNTCVLLDECVYKISICDASKPEII